MSKFLSRSLIIILIFSSSCFASTNTHQIDMNNVAESYVRLVLEVGLYDPDYVDAYYGPAGWKPSEDENSKQEKFPYDKLSSRVNELITELEKVNQNEFGSLEQLRYAFLEKQLLSVKAKIDLLNGKKMSFDDESKALFDAVAPVHDEEYFNNILTKLDKALPGEGDIYKRFNNYRKEFIVPKDKFDVVFKAAMAECRRRTLEHIELPENENFKVEYVTDKPWVAYNGYKGSYFSLIQINTDLPLDIGVVIVLASHEGYPGHHVNLALMEKHLFRDRNWVEYSIIPLFSPQSLIAEGIAEYARIDLVFPENERIEFERTVLFPMAGFDPSKAEQYFNIMRLKDELDCYGVNESARCYLDGKISKDEAIAWLSKYCLQIPEEAKHNISFIENYRSYTINYGLGRDIVKNYIETHGGTDENPEKRWELFYTLLSTPQTPSGLVQKSR